MNVLFVCTGNTCRSPLAEAIGRRLAEERGLEGVTFASAGTHANDGGSATDETIGTARDHGLDLSGFVSRQLTPELAEDADIVLAMAEHHLGDPSVMRARRAELFSTGPIRDPYGLGAGAYRQTYGDLELAVTHFLDEQVGVRS